MQEWDGGNSPGVRDVFDFPDEEPSELFINPFALCHRPLHVEGAPGVRCSLSMET